MGRFGSLEGCKRNGSVLYFFLFCFFLNVYSFSFLKERERGRRRGRERDTESEAGSWLQADSAEPDVRLELTNLEIMTCDPAGH